MDTTNDIADKEKVMITTVTMNAALDKAYFMNHVIENGTVMRVQECRTTAGGKGLNVARAASICGADVQATGLVGGFNGQYLESLLDKDEIPHQFGHVKGETRSYINILDEGYGSTEYLEPGFEVAPEEEQDFMKKFPVLIFLIPRRTANIIEFPAAMFGDQMFHQYAKIRQVVKPGIIESRKVFQKGNGRNTGFADSGEKTFFERSIGDIGKIQDDSVKGTKIRKSGDIVFTGIIAFIGVEIPETLKDIQICIEMVLGGIAAVSLNPGVGHIAFPAICYTRDFFHYKITPSII